MELAIKEHLFPSLEELWKYKNLSFIESLDGISSVVIILCI